MNFDRRFFRNFHMYSAALLAFLIPISKSLTTIAIVLWVIASLLMWVPEGKNRWVKAGLWSMALFYLAHVTGLIYTENMDFALFDLGTKASFILMPFIWRVSKRFTSHQVDLIMGVFVMSVVVKGIFLLSRALWFYTSGEEADVFFYSEFSEMHPSYSAMYALFAFSFLVLSKAGMRNFFGFRQKWLYGILILYLLALVTLFASKAAILITPILIIGLAIFISRFRKSLKKGLTYGASLMAIFVVSLFLSPNTIARFEKMFEETSEAAQEVEIKEDEEKKVYLKSTEARLDAWEASVEVIKSEPLLGAGTGDVKDELEEKYLEMGEELMAEKQVNSHNQYLNSWAAIGLPGILTLLGMFVIGLFEGLRKRKDLFTLFILLVGANIFVESMFEVQGGIVFFAFFYGLLLTEKVHSKSF